MKLNVTAPSPVASTGTTTVLSSSADWLSGPDSSVQVDSKSKRQSKSDLKETQPHWYDDPSAVRGF